MKAIFEFYNLPNMTNAKEGSFYMDVSYSNGQYVFKAGSWIEKPSTYSTVDVTATLRGYACRARSRCRAATPSTRKKPTPPMTKSELHLQQPPLRAGGQGMTWPEAKAYAEAQGGYLAVITSAEEQAFVQSLIAKGEKNQYWLGGYRNGSTFAWVTGEPFSYTNWTAASPTTTARGECTADLPA